MKLGVLVIDVTPVRASKPFRCVFTARAVSLLGIGLLVVAVPAQTYELTESSLHVAGVATTLGLSVCVGSIAGGVLADRCERRCTIQLARSAAGLSFLVLGINALLSEPSLAIIYAASAVDGLAGGISGTTLMAVIPTLVPERKLAAAGALTALTTDIGTVVSPALAGLMIAFGGIALTYFVAVVATAVTVLLIHGLGQSPAPGKNHELPLRALVSGLRFATRAGAVRSVLIVGLLTMLVGGPTVLLPALVDETLEAGPSTLGLLYAAPAVGALVGSLTSGWTGQIQRGGVALLVSAALMPLGVAVAGLSVSALVVVLGLAGHGFGRVLTEILGFALLQHNTPDELRGRVSSLWQMQAVTATSVGSVAAGLLGQWFPPNVALLVYGTAGAVLALLAAVGSGPLWRTVSS